MIETLLMPDADHNNSTVDLPSDPSTGTPLMITRAISDDDSLITTGNGTKLLDSDGAEEECSLTDEPILLNDTSPSPVVNLSQQPSNLKQFFYRFGVNMRAFVSFLVQLKDEKYHHSLTSEISPVRKRRTVILKHESLPKQWIKWIWTSIKHWVNENKVLKLYSDHDKESLAYKTEHSNCEDDSNSLSFRELLFDLVFVVSFIELSYFMAVELSATRIAQTGLIFTTFWLNWYHSNYVLSCVRLHGPWLTLFPIVMFATLSLSCHLREGDDINDNDIFTLPKLRMAAAVFMCLPRLVFAIIWGNIVFFSSPERQTRKNKHGWLVIIKRSTTEIRKNASHPSKNCNFSLVSLLFKHCFVHCICTS